MKRNGLLLVLGLGAVASAACGGKASDTDAATGGAATGGESTSGGGSASGGTTSDGGTASGGQQATGGLGGGPGTGGQPSQVCDCDAPSISVCGVDGRTYDAGCGEACVPVAIECEGQCPCDDGCGCAVEEADLCEEHVTWICSGSGTDIGAAIEAGCDSVGSGLLRFCCPPSVQADAFCAE